MASMHKSFVVAAILAAGAVNPTAAWGCAAWCVLPLCECKSFLFVKYASCRPGFSGDECKCAFERTNIADNSWIIPDSLTGSLVIQKGAASGDLLAGTWTSGYASSTAGRVKFTDVQGGKAGTTNVWSLEEASDGAYVLGTPEGILRAPSSGGAAALVAPGDGVLGGIVDFEGTLVAGSFDGMLVSTDAGKTWAKAPCTGSLNQSSSDGIVTDPVVKPPVPGSRRCDSQVTKLLVSEGRLFAFFAGYGGAHWRSAGSLDWQGLPLFQQDGSEQAPCYGGFCHVQDAVVVSETLFLGFMSRGPVSLKLDQPNATWVPLDVSPRAQDGIAAVAATPGGTVFMAPSDGLFLSRDLGRTWVRAVTEPCGSARPPLFGRGAAVTSSQLVLGTIYGPWVFELAYLDALARGVQFSLAGPSAGALGAEEEAPSSTNPRTTGAVAGSLSAVAFVGALGTVAFIRRRRQTSALLSPPNAAVTTANPAYGAGAV